MDLHLGDRVYVVTGGGQGLGFGAAQALVGEGASVVLSGPRESSLSAAAERLGHEAADRVAWTVADNADAATPDRLIAAAQDRFGRLDGALVSVGGTPPGTVATTPDDAWRSAIDSRLPGRGPAGSGARATWSTAHPTVVSPGPDRVFVLAASVQARCPAWRSPTASFPGRPVWSRCSLTTSVRTGSG